ncbi:hypothetical protein V3N99_22140 (plasmid) [Dermatophilaceae bacterium Soc4.6]
MTKEAAPAKRAAQGGARSTTGRAVRKAATAKRAAPAIAVGSDVGGHRASADLGKVTADFVAALAPENVVQPEADSSVARLLEAVERLRQLMSGRRIDVDPPALLAAALERFVDTIESSSGPEPSGRELTEEQRAVLESVGSYVEDMPPLEERASYRARARWEQLLEDSLATAQVAELLQVGESRIRQRAADRSLYSVTVAGRTRFPAFQFTASRPGGANPRGPVAGAGLSGEPPGWGEVAKAIPEHAHPLAVAYVVTHPSEELGLQDELVSPVDWLASGGSAAVAADVIASALTLA